MRVSVYFGSELKVMLCNQCNQSRRDFPLIAPRFIAGLVDIGSIKSRKGRQILSSLAGLDTDLQLFPAINRGAIDRCSYGAKIIRHYF